MIDMKKEEFSKVYYILEEAFPVSERRNYEGQLSLLNHPKYQIKVLKKAEEILGFMATWKFEDFYFIEHFAINKEARGLGIGSQMLEEYLQEVKGKVFLEVELPETEYAKRRIEFYKRIQFSYNNFEYLQPPLQVGQDFLPLRVMSYPGHVTEEELDYFRSAVYKEVYGLTV